MDGSRTKIHLFNFKGNVIFDEMIRNVLPLVWKYRGSHRDPCFIIVSFPLSCRTLSKHKVITSIPMYTHTHLTLHCHTVIHHRLCSLSCTAHITSHYKLCLNIHMYQHASHYKLCLIVAQAHSNPPPT